MEVKVGEHKTEGKYFQFIANTKEDVKSLEEVTGRNMEQFVDDDLCNTRILAVVLVPFSAITK